MIKGQNREKKVPDITWVEKKQTLSAEDEPVLDYELHLPKLEGETLPFSRINRCYQKTAHAWERRWREQVFPAANQEREAKRSASRPFVTWRAWVTGTITEQNEELLSVRMEAGEIRGDGKPCLMCWGEIWDLGSGVPYPVKDLVSGQRKWRREVLPQILEQGRARRAAGDCFLDRDWEEKAGKLLLWREPCLTKRGLEFYLPQCALAPAAEGIPAFVVPVRK